MSQHVVFANWSLSLQGGLGLMDSPATSPISEWRNNDRRIIRQQMPQNKTALIATMYSSALDTSEVITCLKESSKCKQRYNNTRSRR